MPYAELGAVRLYYERAGSGECDLLFVHGWCCDRNAFRPQFDHFARTHAVTALDLRGCGRSDQPEDGYTIPDFADDLRPGQRRDRALPRDRGLTPGRRRLWSGARVLTGGSSGDTPERWRIRAS